MGWVLHQITGIEQVEGVDEPYFKLQCSDIHVPLGALKHLQF